MIIKGLKKQILSAVEKVAKIVPSKATLPVISGILLEAKDGKLHLKGTNLEFSLEAQVVVEIEKEGVIAVPASIFARTLKTMRDTGVITISVKDKRCVIESADGVVSINTLDHTEFPTIPQPDTTDSFTISSEVLLSGFQSVMHSASTSLIKPELSAVYVYPEGGSAVFVATDQFRLAEKKVPVKDLADFPPVIIPLANVHEFIHAFSGESTSLEVFVDEDQISIRTPELYATSRIVNGSFPDYKVIIPKEFVTEVVLLKEDFANSLQKISIFADKFGKTTLHIDPEKNEFRLTAENNEIGSVEDTPKATVSGESRTISFNYRYLKDTLPSIASDSIQLRFAQPHQPLVIQGVQDEEYLYLVMPMNQ